jgi:hypothetical protein
MTHVDATEEATRTEALRQESSEFSARFENGVVTHFEARSGGVSVSTANPQARHVKGDAIASEVRRGQVRRCDDAVKTAAEPKSQRDETARISRVLEAGDFGANFKTKTQPSGARIFQVRGEAKLPR